MAGSGICAFCEEHAELRESHVLPAFAYRWLRSRSGKGHLRSSDNPNLRVQDGLKLNWLCDACEGRFSRFETAFAGKIFHPWMKGNYEIEYDDLLVKFCVSVSWRVLKYAYGLNKDRAYTDEQKELVAKAEKRWRSFLLEEEPNPAKFEQHLVIFNIAEETTISNLPTNFNRYMTGAITFDIVGSSRSMMTFAKLGRFIIFGMIQKGAGPWEGTKVHIKHGLLKPDKVVIPAALLDLFREKANFAESSMSLISENQMKKIEDNLRKNADAYIGSEHFKAMKADIDMFGSAAVFK